MMRSFLRFGGVSGLGWLVDFCLLLMLVRAGLPAGLANGLSSVVAATGVFLVTRKLVFQGDPEGVPKRVVFYMLYTLAVIGLASAAMAGIVAGLERLAIFDGLGPGGLSALAKVLVTPPQLVLNFLVARGVAQRRLSHAAPLAKRSSDA